MNFVFHQWSDARMRNGSFSAAAAMPERVRDAEEVEEQRLVYTEWREGG